MVRSSTLALALFGLLAAACVAEAQTGPNKPQQPIPRESRAAHRLALLRPYAPSPARSPPAPPAIARAARPRAGTAP